MTTYVCVVLLAALASVLLTPLVRGLAFRLGLFDEPDGRRKMHTERVALGGGLVVLLAVLVALTVTLLVPNPLRHLLYAQGVQLPGLLLASVLICLVGLADDRRGLRGRQKVLGQLLAAMILIVFGMEIRHISVFGVVIELGLLALPFSLFWLLGAMNALNLLDGTDGLATSIGMIMTLAIASLAMMTGHGAQAVIALALFGSLLGFLFFNFPPAKIYLGDAGSMLIGLLAGALAIQCSLKGPATVAIAAPLALWAIPIFDSAMAIVRRKLTGRSIYETDRAHLHHCLLKRGWQGRGVLGFVSMMCALTALGALGSVWLHNELYATVSALAVVAMLVVTGIFGQAELALLLARLRSTGASMFHGPPARSSGTADGLGSGSGAVKIQGVRDWQELWELLLGSAASFSPNAVQLDINIPQLHESYHAHWRRTTSDSETDGCWTAKIPLVVNGHRVGRIEMAAPREAGPMSQRWGAIASLVESVERRIRGKLGDALSSAAHGPDPSAAAVPAQDSWKATGNLLAVTDLGSQDETPPAPCPWKSS